MKYLMTLILGIILTGCATKGVNTTMFLKEDYSRLYNLKGEECSESGYQVDKDRDEKVEEHHNLTTYYSNCDVHRVRRLQEFEPKQWGIEPKKGPK